MYALTQDIYEKAVGDAYPVVRHVFYGKTRDEAQRYFDAHMTTDQFMRDCTERGQWDEVVCQPQEAGAPVEHVLPINPADRAICISKRQRAWHVGSELAAVALVVPFMAYLATRKQLPGWARVGAAGVGIFSLVLDGALLYRYLKAGS